MSDTTYDETRNFYSQRGFAGRVGFGQHPALVVVDFIIGFTDPASPLAGDLEKPLAQTLRILEAARHTQIPVFHTTVEYSQDMKDAGLFPQKIAGLKWLVAGSRWVELDSRLAKRPEEVLIKKKYASAFFATDLAEELKGRGVDTLIITGCTTSGCIRATAVDALQHGFRAIVPTEAVGDRARLPHEANLFDIDAKYGDVVSVDEVLTYLERVHRRKATQAAAARQK